MNLYVREFVSETRDEPGVDSTTVPSVAEEKGESRLENRIVAGA